MKPLPPRPARGTGLALRLAAFALVVLAEAMAARWFDIIDTLTLAACLAAVLVLALLAVGVTLFAFRDVWRDGATGSWRAVGALALALVCLAPFAAAAGAVAAFPALHDVSTDPDDPPPFRHRPPLPPAAVADLLAPPAAAAALQAAAYPDILPKSVPLSTVEAYAAARLAALELGWRLAGEEEPAGETDSGLLEAEARSLVLGTPEDVVVRVTPSATGCRVDVRSASRFPAHDLGENARRIRAFYQRFEDILGRTAGG